MTRVAIEGGGNGPCSPPDSPLSLAVRARGQEARGRKCYGCGEPLTEAETYWFGLHTYCLMCSPSDGTQED